VFLHRSLYMSIMYFCSHTVVLVVLEYSVAIDGIVPNENHCWHVTNLFGVMFVCVRVFVSILQ
jgi:hypothetical protein